MPVNRIVAPTGVGLLLAAAIVAGCSDGTEGPAGANGADTIAPPGVSDDTTIETGGSMVPPLDSGTTGADAARDDARSEMDAMSGADAAASTDAATNTDAAVADAGSCINGVPSPGSGHHNPGQDCMSCHDTLSKYKWTVAGTLYSAASGGTAVSGATIEIVDANGKKLLLSTYDNGNFYTTSPVTFPVTARASKCPSDAKAAGLVPNGRCNSSSCHGSGMRLHLP